MSGFAGAAAPPLPSLPPATTTEPRPTAGDGLGAEDQPFWKDHKSAKINAIRTRRLIGRADVVVVRFGDTYKQWNAAFDAGYAAALNKPIITLHGSEHRHALKEVDAAALAVASTPQQVVKILEYVTTQV